MTASATARRARTPTLRPLREDEADAGLDLLEYAFGREPSRGERREELRRRFRPERTLGCFYGDELAASLEIVPLEIYLQDRRVPMGLIAGVATWPEHRRKGLMGRLLVTAVAEMRRAGQIVSHLAPFSFPFYRRYGWEILDDLVAGRFERANVPDWDDFQGRVTRREPDVAVLDRVYDGFARRYNGMAARSEERWRDSILARKMGHLAVYEDDEGTPLGYVIYGFERRELVVHEFVHLTRDAYLALWNFIRRHDSRFETVTFRTPVDDPLPVLLRDPESVDRRIVPHFMARITDVAAFLEAYTFLPSRAGAHLSLGVHDPQAAWNDGAFSVRIDAEGRARVLPGREDGPSCTCDIATLSMLLMGYRRARPLVEAGRLEASPEALAILEDLVPRRPPCYLDFGK